MRHVHKIPTPGPLAPGEISVAEAATRLGISADAVYYWIKAGHLAARRGPGNRLAITWTPEIETSCRARITSSGHLNRPNPNPSPQERQYETAVPTVADRVVQAALKLVLEPIFEADFKPVSYGFRPEAAGAGRDRRDPPLRHQRLSLGAGGGHRRVLGCIVTLLLSLIVLIKTGCLVGLGAGYAGLFGVRCGRGRRGVRRA